MIQGQPQSFSTFAPLALAAIGTLPLPLMSRSIVIRMERHDGSLNLRRFDSEDTGDLDLIYRQIVNWARDVVLNPEPDIPDAVRNRQADNWRPLLAITDACGPAWGALAREAAIAFTRGYHDEDPVVLLLRDVLAIFNARGADRIPSEVLVADLNELEDAPWAEWRGVHDDQQPRRLSQNMLASLLRSFLIRPRKFWPLRRGPTSKSFRGYFRSQFEQAWRSYCQEGGTPEQRNNISYLRSR
jgi:hypothetical protein